MQVVVDNIRLDDEEPDNRTLLVSFQLIADPRIVEKKEASELLASVNYQLINQIGFDRVLLQNETWTATYSEILPGLSDFARKSSALARVRVRVNVRVTVRVGVRIK